MMDFYHEVRPLQLIQHLLTNKFIHSDDKTLYSFEEAYLLCQEIKECSGKVCKAARTHSLKTHMRYVCKCPEHCDFEISFVGLKTKKGEPTTSHQLVSLTSEHSSTCRSKNIKGTSYSEDILAHSMRSFMEDKIRKGRNQQLLI